jgi:hypothetical protein
MPILWYIVEQYCILFVCVCVWSLVEYGYAWRGRGEGEGGNDQAKNIIYL